jgi:ribosomal protein S12 methylthiotransferase
MRAKSNKSKIVNVVTLGCSKNLVDSEVLMGQLKANAFEVTHESENNQSSIVIINTCGFIENAKQESIDTILRYADAKNEGWIEKLYVTGCLSERYKSDLEKEIPEVDAYFGTRELPRLLKTLKADYKKELLGERLLTTPNHYAFLKISEGCDRPCTFCAIPLMRGAHVSVPIEELVLRAEKLATNGTKELLIIAQDSTYYGLDLYKKRELARLLNALSEVKGIEWIRLHYAFPSGFPDDLIEVIRDNPKICKYLDMPLQHISNHVLQNMKRGTTREKTIELVKKLRDRIPSIAIRTTLIAGFPGETPEEHEEMLQWVEETKFDRLGIFTYSHEENTDAFALNDDVEAAEKKRRADAVMELQQRISYENNQKKIGQTLKVIIDRFENGYFIGRSEYDSPDVDNEVLIQCNDEHYLSPGSFVNVKINEAGDYDLIAKIIE